MSSSCTKVSVSVVNVVFIHTMEDDQRLNTLVHEGDTALRLFLHYCRKTEILYQAPTCIFKNGFHAVLSKMLKV